MDNPRLLQHLPTVLALAVFAACFLRYRQRWFMPGYATYLLDVHRSVTAGTAIAPNQYRPLMPWAAQLLADAAGLTLPQAVLVLDGLLLAVAVAALLDLLARLDARPMLLPAAAVFAFWFGKLDHWSPETMLLIALVAVAVRELTAPRPRWSVLGGVAFLMLGARTDYAATLGLTLLAVAWHRRSAELARVGVAAGIGAVLATLGWARIYPQAHYAVDVVQLPYNVSLGALAAVALYYGPVLLTPALLTARRRALPPLWPALAWFAAQFAVTFVVGRPDESRLFMPFAAVLGVAAMLAWRELRRDELPVLTT